MLVVIQRPEGECVFDTESKAEAKAEYRDWHVSRRGQVWEIDLVGAHEGPPVRIEILNVHWERDEDDGASYPDYDNLNYENGESIDDTVSDFYMDAIREKLRACLDGA